MARGLSLLIALGFAACLACSDGAPWAHGGNGPDESDAVAVRVAGLALDAEVDSPIVILAEADGERRLPIWIGAAEAHSIASELPRFFQGRLTDLNFGTASGASCASELIDRVLEPVAAQSAFSSVLNGRFKGGYITRRYGAPDRGTHAIQLEMSQRIYMDESAPFAFRPDLAARVAPLIRDCLRAALDWLR